MNNSATDRIRAKLTPAGPHDAASDAASETGTTSASVTIDEDYLTSLFGNSEAKADAPSVSNLPSSAVSDSADAKRELELLNQVANDTPQQPAVEAQTDLISFHSAVQNSALEARQESAAPIPAEKAVSAPAGPQRTDTNSKKRTVRVIPATQRTQPVTNAKSSTPETVKSPAVQQRSDAFPAAPNTSEARPVPVAVVPAPQVEFPVLAPAPEIPFDAPSQGGKQKILLIGAAAAVLLVGGGVALFRQSPTQSAVPTPVPTAQTTPEVVQSAPASGVGNAAPPTAPTPAPSPGTPTTQAVPAANAKGITGTDKGPQPLPAATALPATPPPPAQPVVEARNAPKQFVPPTVAPKQQTASPLVAEIPPNLAANLPGGAIALPNPTSLSTIKLPTPAVPTATPAVVTAPQISTAPPPAAAKPTTLTRLKTVNPEYPAAARRAHIAGTVVFTVTVGKDGKVTNLKPISGQQMLVTAARTAISQWVYAPPTSNGQPTEATTQVELNFSLDQK